jgi:hypothetical protein
MTSAMLLLFALQLQLVYHVVAIVLVCGGDSCSCSRCCHSCWQLQLQLVLSLSSVLVLVSCGGGGGGGGGCKGTPLTSSELTSDEPLPLSLTSVVNRSSGITSGVLLIECTAEALPMTADKCRKTSDVPLFLFLFVYFLL